MEILKTIYNGVRMFTQVAQTILCAIEICKRLIERGVALTMEIYRMVVDAVAAYRAMRAA